jgi:hypothetical protein
MEQVMELLDLIRGELVATSFIVRRVQPCKERAHPGFDYRGDDDGTRERTEQLTKKNVLFFFAIRHIACFSLSRQE